ncbi:SAM-dependent methyltransferase [Actinoallomurus vinaceus]|uniref:SAM-dependent methyltransferase n=2 Tax=Actinoallomurus vinaceus TaxID=1080074 RepID=A0ABP8URY5_9ACTN
MLDYMLGGKDHFAADRAAADRALALAPELPMMARESRKFLNRAVRFLVGAGIRQFVDIGCGLPTQSPVHEVAQAAAPDARVVYVDNDPLVVNHAQALLTHTARTAAIHADLREPDELLAHPRLTDLIDLGRPVGVVLVGVLGVIPEDDVARSVVDRLRRAVVPGSHLVMTQAISDVRPEVTEQLSALYQDEQIVRGSRRRNVRTRAEVETYFEGLELAEPGIVHVPAWRPDPGEPSVDPRDVWAIAGVGRKP